MVIKSRKSPHVCDDPQIKLTFSFPLIPWSTIFEEADSCPADQYIVFVSKPGVSLSCLQDPAFDPSPKPVISSP